MSISVLVTDGYGQGGSIGDIVSGGFGQYGSGSGSGSAVFPINRTVEIDTAENPLVTGDTFNATCVLKAGDPLQVYDFTDASIKVAVVSGDHNGQWCDSVDQTISLPGNTPSQGVLKVRLTTSATGQCETFVTGTAEAKLEIQVTDSNGVNTWFADIYVMKGNVE